MRNWIIFLLLLNIGLWTYGMNWLMWTAPSEQAREPARLLQQRQPESIQVAFDNPKPSTPATNKNSTVANTTTTSNQSSTPVNPDCIEWGGFTPQEIPKALAWLSQNYPRQSITHRGTKEISKWLISLEKPFKSLDQARSRLRQLEQSYSQTAITLGDDQLFHLSIAEFDTEEEAQNFLRGKDNKLSNTVIHKQTLRLVWLGLPSISPEVIEAMKENQAKFPKQTIQACQAIEP